MQIHIEQFEELKRYLLHDIKLKDSKKNVLILKSRFRIMCRFFADKEFNRENFINFMEYMREKGYSTAYCNQFIKMAKHVDKYYKVDELKDFSLYPKETKFVDILTNEEMIALAEVRLPYTRQADQTNDKYRGIIYVMYFTGARISEILYLRWEDMRDTPIPMLVINQTKVSELRYAPIPLSLYRDLRRLPHFSGYIFSSEQGHVLDVTTINHTLKKRALAIGLKKRVYNHLFRHSFINLMLRGGARIHEVSRLVGHKSLETTNAHYVHIMIEELNDVLNAYHPALKSSQTIESLTKRVREMCANILDAEQFNLQVLKRKKKVTFEISERNE